MDIDAMSHAAAPTSLSLAFANRRPDEATLFALVAGLLDPLEDFHRSGHIHGNVSPAGVLWNDHGKPSLGPPGEPPQMAADGSLRLQVQPGFSPLEAYLRHGAVGPACDLYGLGAVIYWLMTGEPPAEAPRRARDNAPLAVPAGSYSAAWNPLLAALLALDPDQRPHDVADLRGRLAALQAVLTARGSGSPTAPYRPDGQRLEQVRTALTQHLVGPVATAVINQALRKSADWAAFCTAVATHIDNEKLRDKFLAGFLVADSAATPSMTSPVPASAFPPDLLTALEGELKNILGAVAPIVIRRAAGKTQQRHELLTLIAAEVDNPQRARQFLAWAEAQFGMRPDGKD
jgi:hypothetical protein